MSKMAVAGMQATFDAHALMTDSASTGTAFACGIKTKSGVIGMDDSAGTGYKSVAQLAHESGYSVGILSSVSASSRSRPSPRWSPGFSTTGARPRVPWPRR